MNKELKIWCRLKHLKFSLLGMVGLGMIFSMNVWSLPWLPPSLPDGVNHKQDKKRHVSVVNEAIDFSGAWEGECNNQKIPDLLIWQDSNTIILKYDFMEEKYTIGDLMFENHSKRQQLEAGSSTVNWNAQRDSLIFINTQHVKNENGELNVFFSKVSMSLMDDNLMINGEYYQSPTDAGDVARETIVCKYSLKSKLQKVR